MQPFKWYWEIVCTQSSQCFSTVLLVLEQQQCERPYYLHAVYHFYSCFFCYICKYLPSLHLFDQKYSKKLILILQFKVTELKWIEFLWAHLSAFKCVAHETETWTFLIIIHFENSCAASFFFLGFSDEEKVQKNSIYFFEIEIFCNVIHVFTLTVDQCNLSLLIENIIFFSKKINKYWPPNFKQ